MTTSTHSTPSGETAMTAEQKAAEVPEPENPEIDPLPHYVWFRFGDRLKWEVIGIHFKRLHDDDVQFVRKDLADRAVEAAREVNKDALVSAQSALSYVYHREGRRVLPETQTHVYEALCEVERAIKSIEAAAQSDAGEK